MTDVVQDTITITVDGKAIEARPGELLIAAAERAGIFIPRFCWHKRMDPVGACRMCIVDVEGSPPIPGTDQRRPQTSCTTVVREGMVVHTQYASEEINDAQKTILELLLINHPLDCPICDRAGECPLQDQVQDYGPNESKFIEPKRRFIKPVAISPLINLDRERCILCYRCTRFCEELSGDVLIGVMERGPEAFIYPYHSDGEINQTFDSYFSGNTVQICPVGALTSTEYRFQSRPWDLQVQQTTCNLCASGCAMYAGVRVQDGKIARFSAATNEETNEEWLCDKGRFGTGYLSAPTRLTYPYVRKGDELAPASWDEAFDVFADKLKPVLDGTAKAAMIVGESLLDEDYYVAQKFARLVLRTNNIDHRLEGGLSADALIRPEVTYDDALASDLVVLVDLDAREELPLLFLRLRIAASKRDLPIALVNPRDVSLSEYAKVHARPVPGDVTVPAEISEALAGASSPVIILGPRTHTPDAIAAWQAAAQASGAKLTWAPRRAGTYGALAAGAHPDLLPGWRPISDDDATQQIADAWTSNVPAEAGLDVRGMLEAAAKGELDVLWLVGADILADTPDPDLARRALDAAPFVVLQDVQSTQLLHHADVVLPAAAFVERDGTLTDWEGRRQGVHAAVHPPGAARADYAILAESARRLGRPIGCRTHTDAKDELDALLASSLSPGGVGGRGAERSRGPEDGSPPHGKDGSPPQDEGLRLQTYRLLYDDGSRISKTNGVAEMTQEPFVEINVEDAQAAGITDGRKVDVTTSHGSLSLDARVTKQIAKGVVFIPQNQPGANTNVLFSWEDRTPTVELRAGGVGGVPPQEA